MPSLRLALAASLLAFIVPFASACGGSSESSGAGGAGAAAGTAGTSGASGGSGDGGSGDGGSGGTGTTGCATMADTSATATTSPSGCVVLDRDTSSCRADREAAGLAGFWLSFACRVTLSRGNSFGAEVVSAKSDDLPDHASNYFAASDPCHETYTGGIQNPNQIRPQGLDVSFPATPSGASEAMRGAVVGLALNGVAIFGDFAAPGDDIFGEAKTFDRCGAHPQMSGVYHYHGEPYALSYDDDRLIGVLRDGYAVYGRRDPDGSLPTLDADGGHVGPTVDDASDHYHHHLSLQTSTDARTLGQQQWFLTTGKFHGTPAFCQACG